MRGENDARKAGVKDLARRKKRPHRRAFMTCEGEMTPAFLKHYTSMM